MEISGVACLTTLKTMALISILIEKGNEFEALNFLNHSSQVCSLFTLQTPPAKIVKASEKDVFGRRCIFWKVLIPGKPQMFSWECDDLTN